MTVREVYRFVRRDGGVTVSPRKPEGEYTLLSRLIADEGWLITDGTDFYECIDVDSPEGYREVVSE